MNALTATTLALGLVVGSACAAPVEKTIEIVGPPIKLRYGEVHNAWQPPIDFPDEVKQKFANKTMPIVDWTVDIVYKNGSQVPLYDTYNHVSPLRRSLSLSLSLSQLLTTSLPALHTLRRDPSRHAEVPRHDAGRALWTPCPQRHGRLVSLTSSSSTCFADSFS